MGMRQERGISSCIRMHFAAGTPQVHPRYTQCTLNVHLMYTPGNATVHPNFLSLPYLPTFPSSTLHLASFRLTLEQTRHGSRLTASSRIDVSGLGMGMVRGGFIRARGGVQLALVHPLGPGAWLREEVGRDQPPHAPQLSHVEAVVVHVAVDVDDIARLEAELRL